MNKAAAERAKENSCLAALCAGRDAWEEFLDLFDITLYCEFAALGIRPGAQRDDLLQELALKLLAHDWRIVRRHLAADHGCSFQAILRTVVRSIVIDEWRREQRWRQLADLADEAAPAELLNNVWALDPAEAYYRETRLASILAGVVRRDRRADAFQLLYLRYVEGLPVNVIAGRLGLAPNAVSQRLRYYHRKLASIFGRSALREWDEGSTVRKPVS